MTLVSTIFLRLVFWISFSKFNGFYVCAPLNEKRIMKTVLMSFIFCFALLTTKLATFNSLLKVSIDFYYITMKKEWDRKYVKLEMKWNMSHPWKIFATICIEGCCRFIQKVNSFLTFNLHYNYLYLYIICRRLPILWKLPLNCTISKYMEKRKAIFEKMHIIEYFARSPKC